MTEPQKTYSHLQVEAALCIWEEFLMRTEGSRTCEHTALVTYWQMHGTVALRHLSIGLADYCLAVYDAIPEDDRYGHPYDWEIIPRILDTIDWNLGPEIRLPPVEAAAIVARALG